MKNMTTLKWLLKREIWENKGLLIWSNLVVAGVILLFTIPAILRLSDVTLNAGVAIDLQINAMATGITHQFTSGVIVFSTLMVFTLYSYATGCLMEERKDRSILFWKSLPISDELTVLSKLIVAVILFPLMAIVTVTLTTFTSMFFLCCAYALHGVGLFSNVFGMNGVWGQIWHMFLSFPVYVAWALPSICWMMLVSSWVKHRAGLWAILIPIGIFVLSALAKDIVGISIDMRRFAYVAIFRGIASIVPDSWSSHYYLGEYARTQSLPESIQHVLENVDLASWEIFSSADVWLGIIAGILMFLAAYKIRRSRGE